MVSAFTNFIKIRFMVSMSRSSPKICEQTQSFKCHNHSDSEWLLWCCDYCMLSCHNLPTRALALIEPQWNRDLYTKCYVTLKLYRNYITRGRKSLWYKKIKLDLVMWLHPKCHWNADDELASLSSIYRVSFFLSSSFWHHLGYTHSASRVPDLNAVQGHNFHTLLLSHIHTV